MAGTFLLVLLYNRPLWRLNTLLSLRLKSQSDNCFSEQPFETAKPCNPQCCSDGALMALQWQEAARNSKGLIVSLFSEKRMLLRIASCWGGGGITSHSELSRRRDVFFVVVFFFFLRLQFCLDPRRTCLWKERSCIRQLLSPGNDEKPNFFFN